MKKCPIFEKVAKTVAKPKKSKISIAKLNLKDKISTFNHTWNIIWFQQPML